MDWKARRLNRLEGGMAEGFREAAPPVEGKEGGDLQKSAGPEVGFDRGILAGLSVPVLVIMFLIGVGVAESPGEPALSGINRTWLDRSKGPSVWGRDPFHFPRRENSGEGPAQGIEDLGGLRLTAILYSDKGSVAIISHKIVRRGDRVGERTVVSILEDRVFLQDLSGVYELRLDRFSAE